MSKQITHGFHLVKGKAFHEMEDYVVAKFKEVDANELDLFATFDGHLFENILKEPNFWQEPETTIKKANEYNDSGQGIWFGERRFYCCDGHINRLPKVVVAKQLSVDHEPNMEKDEIENIGGFVSNFPGISFDYNT